MTRPGTSGSWSGQQAALQRFRRRVLPLVHGGALDRQGALPGQRLEEDALLLGDLARAAEGEPQRAQRRPGRQQRQPHPGPFVFPRDDLDGGVFQQLAQRLGVLGQDRAAGGDRAGHHARAVQQDVAGRGGLPGRHAAPG